MTLKRIEDAEHHTDMQRAAEQCERVVAVLSPDYLTSKFTAPGWAIAFAQDPTGEH